MQTNTVRAYAQKFNDAEQMWFWFMSSVAVRDGFHRDAPLSNRPCELVDIETMITKLYLSGKLSRDELSVMQEFGMRRRAPHQHIYRENRAAALWSSAMRTIDTIARDKDWIE